jgi:RNA polymerase sigma-70 factor (ECF subfamily)
MSHHADRDERTVRFERLFRAHYATVAGYVGRRAEPGLRDDLVNEVFLVAWRRFDQVPPNPRPWLLAVARNVLGTHIRGARRARALKEQLASVEVEWTASEQPLTCGDVASALSALRPDDCEALMLVNWEGLRPSEAARVLGESPATFRVRLHRARARFRALLEQSMDGAGDPGRRCGSQSETLNVTREVPNV